MTARLAEIESMLNKKHVDLFSKIQSECENSLDKDIVNVGIRVARFFQILWLGIACVAGLYSVLTTIKKFAPNIAHWISR